MARSAAALKRRAEKRGVPLELQKIKDSKLPTKPSSNKSKPSKPTTSSTLQATNDCNNTTSITSLHQHKKKITDSFEKCDIKLKKNNTSTIVGKRLTKNVPTTDEWFCRDCQNMNFSFRDICNRCQRPKP
jgi:hypothetical protein